MSKSITQFLLALARVWWALMSTAAFTGLSVWSALSSNGGKITVIGTASLAIFFFLVASYIAWREENIKAIKFETEVNDRKAKFVINPSYNLWQYDAEVNKTIFFVLCKVINQGYPSVITGSNAYFCIGNSRELMTSFHIPHGYTMRVGNELIKFTQNDLLLHRVADKQIPRGGAVLGRILLTLPGDRSGQVNALGFRIEFEFWDYLGTKFESLFTPDVKPTPNLIFSGKEKVTLHERSNTTVLPAPE